MKKIQVQNQKKANAKRYVLFTVIFIALSVIMITNAFSNNVKLKEENYNTVEGIVSVLEVKENEIKNYKQLRKYKKYHSHRLLDMNELNQVISEIKSYQ